MAVKILRVDETHPLLDDMLRAKGLMVDVDLHSPYEEILRKIGAYDGLVIRSRFPVDKTLLSRAKKLKFIARVGSGTEGIDKRFAAQQGISVFNAPEGNRNAVAEYAVMALLSLLRKFPASYLAVREGGWDRKAFRGFELEGKTVAIIGYGNTGKTFARKLAGFDTEVLCNDILPGVGDEYARQTELDEIFSRADIVSFHVPLTEKTRYMASASFFDRFAKPFFLINTSRGEVVNTKDLSDALRQGKILGAALDVLEYENPSFIRSFSEGEYPSVLRELLQRDNVIITPHIAGITYESYEKLARVTAGKILEFLGMA